MLQLVFGQLVGTDRRWSGWALDAVVDRQCGRTIDDAHVRE